jgi:hypothetical protein
MKCNIYACGLIIVIGTVGFSGCTVIGFTLGTGYDHRHTITRSSSMEQLEKTKKDIPLKIYLYNNQTVGGTFLGIEKTDSSQYRYRYNDFRTKHDDVDFPALNDTITIQHNFTIQKSRYRFSGLDFNSLELHSLTANDISRMPLDNVSAIIDKHNNKLKSFTLRRYMDLCILPLRSEILLCSSGDRFKIPLENIKMIKPPETLHGRIIGLIVGLGIDIYIIWRLVKSDFSFLPMR